MPTQNQIDDAAQAAKTAYGDIYNVFCRLASTEGASLRPIRSECFMVGKRVSGFEVAGALRIELLPKRHRAAGKIAPAADRIAVLMSSKDIYKFDDSKPSAEASYLDQSYVDIGYYHVPVRAGMAWQALLGIRYDFGVRGAKEGHPIFHAQICNGSAGSSIMSLSGTPCITPLPSKEVFDVVRMPTANMIGASALLKLSADHLSHGSFVAVLNRLRSLNFFGNWRCNCATLDHVDSARGMLALGWYGVKP